MRPPRLTLHMLTVSGNILAPNAELSNDFDGSLLEYNQSNPKLKEIRCLFSGLELMPVS